MLTSKIFVVSCLISLPKGNRTNTVKLWHLLVTKTLSKTCQNFPKNFSKNLVIWTPKSKEKYLQLQQQICSVDNTLNKTETLKGKKRTRACALTLHPLQQRHTHTVHIQDNACRLKNKPEILRAYWELSARVRLIAGWCIGCWLQNQPNLPETAYGDSSSTGQQQVSFSHMQDLDQCKVVSFFKEPFWFRGGI